MAEAKKASRAKIWIYLIVILVLAAGAIYLVVKNSANADVLGKAVSQSTSRSTVIKGTVMNQNITNPSTPIKLKVSDGLKGMAGRTITVYPTLKSTPYSIISTSRWTGFYYDYEYRLKVGQISKGTNLIVAGVMNGTTSMSATSMAEERSVKAESLAKWAERNRDYIQTIAEGVVTSAAERNGDGIFKFKIEKGLGDLIGKEIAVNPTYNYTTYSVLSSVKTNSAEYSAYMDKLAVSEVEVGTRLLIAGKLVTPYNNGFTATEAQSFAADQIVEMPGAPIPPIPYSPTPTATVTSCGNFPCPPPAPSATPTARPSVVGANIPVIRASVNGQEVTVTDSQAISVNVGQEIIITADWPQPVASSSLSYAVNCVDSSSAICAGSSSDYISFIQQGGGESHIGLKGNALKKGLLKIELKSESQVDKTVYVAVN